MSNKEFIKREKEIDIKRCQIKIKELLLELDKLREDDKVEVSYCA